MLTVSEDIAAKSHMKVDARGELVSLFVWAQQPINVFVMSSDEYKVYRERKRFKHFGPGTVRFYSSTLRMPRSRKWMVVIENPHPTPVQVDYRVI